MFKKNVHVLKKLFRILGFFLSQSPVRTMHLCQRFCQGHLLWRIYIAFFFFDILMVSFAHQFKNRRITRALKFHLWIGVQPIAGLCHTFLTRFADPSCCNNPNSNLKGWCTCEQSVGFVSRMIGTSSDFSGAELIFHRWN